jgi:hypothetical protein
VKERRGRVSGAVGGLADNVAAAVRRRQQDREPRALVYDAAGHSRVLPVGAKGREPLLEAAERLIALAEPEDANAAESAE